MEQPPELEIDKDEGRALEALVKEANAICTKWVLNTEFAVGTDQVDGKETPTVIVKKKLEANCCSTVHWDRTMLELKLQFLREFAASLENVVSFTADDTPRSKTCRSPSQPRKLLPLDFQVIWLGTVGSLRTVKKHPSLRSSSTRE